MKNIEFKLKRQNDPFIQGFCSFFMQNFAIYNNLDLEDYGGKNGLVRGNKIVISDHQECDIGLMNVDVDSSPPPAKVVFCNAKKDYRSNEFFFPYLQNAQNESLLLDIFDKTAKYEKKYNCVAIFNSHTHRVRTEIKNKLSDICEVIIIDNINIKNQGKELNGNIDHWDLMRSSNFCICPPGHVNETYRFYEALKCHCIPIEFNSECKRLKSFSDKYVISYNDLQSINELEYSIEELLNAQENIDREKLLYYLVNKISSFGIG